MNEENFKAWINELRTTDKPQSQSALCSFDADGEVGYCCLGLGSLMVPDIRIRGHIEGEGSLAAFGVDETEDKAPIEFINWLGLNPLNPGELTEWDLVPDWPEGLSTQGKIIRLGGSRHVNAAVGTYETQCTAAMMNDAGMTFAQIADTFEFFGMGGAVE